MTQNDDEYVVHYQANHSHNSSIAITFLTLLGSAWAIGVTYAIGTSVVN